MSDTVEIGQMPVGSKFAVGSDVNGGELITYMVVDHIKDQHLCEIVSMDNGMFNECFRMPASLRARPIIDRGLIVDSAVDS
jgi:hypothetical protein